MGYTLGEAAKATGKTKGTISKAIKKGTVSAAKKETGEYDIDPSELHRVYPPVSGEQDATPVSHSTAVDTDLLIENRVLKAQLDTANDREKLKDGIIGDLREDRDRWRQQATTLLTDQRPKKRKWRLWGGGNTGT